ncbi:hypothetical protein KKF34_09780 [Myxococcota bacterium]|nr:hypothetical protein [Myxococcota bacterium]MBU1497154.1 hypothetical protein [Myxococcota bacterium]
MTYGFGASGPQPVLESRVWQLFSVMGLWPSTGSGIASLAVIFGDGILALNRFWNHASRSYFR